MFDLLQTCKRSNLPNSVNSEPSEASQVQVLQIETSVSEWRRNDNEIVVKRARFAPARNLNFNCGERTRVIHGCRSIVRTSNLEVEFTVQTMYQTTRQANWCTSRHECGTLYLAKAQRKKAFQDVA